MIGQLEDLLRNANTRTDRCINCDGSVMPGAVQCQDCFRNR